MTVRFVKLLKVQGLSLLYIRTDGQDEEGSTVQLVRRTSQGKSRPFNKFGAWQEIDAKIKAKMSCLVGLQDVILQAMYLRAVLVRHNGSLSGAGVGTEYDPILVDDAHDGCARAHCQRRLIPVLEQLCIALKMRDERDGELDRWKAALDLPSGIDEIKGASHFLVLKVLCLQIRQHVV